MRRKIGRYGLQWQVTDEARWNAPNLRERIARADVVFLGSEVPDAARMALMQCCYDLHRDVMCKAKLQDIMLSSAHQTIVDDAPFLEMDYAKMTLGAALRQAGDGHCAFRVGAGGALAAAGGDRGVHPRRGRRAGDLPSKADDRGRPGVYHQQIPDDAALRR